MITDKKELLDKFLKSRNKQNRIGLFEQSISWALNAIESLDGRLSIVENENDELSADVEYYREEASNWEFDCTNLNRENESLREDIGNLECKCDDYENELNELDSKIEDLEDEIEDLKYQLELKEKGE